MFKYQHGQKIKQRKNKTKKQWTHTSVFCINGLFSSSDVETQAGRPLPG